VLEDGIMRQLILVFLTVVTAVGQGKSQQDKSPSLDSTLEYMRNTLSRYTYMHTTGKDQELNLKGGEPCRIYVESQITVTLHTPQDGVYPFEYQFHLGTIDPDSVKVVTDDAQKNKPEGWKLTNVHLAAMDNRPTIFASASEWKKSKKMPKTLQLATFTDFDFQFRDREQAERFAKALKHAVTLCGGKPSAF
jgi:hypothetical protein